MKQGSSGAGGRVGLAGLGLMGLACAARLEGAGHALLGYDVDTARRVGFEGPQRGAATCVAALIECDAIVLAVFDTAQVEAVVAGDGGLIEAGLASGRMPPVLCTSTCDPDRIALLAARCAAAGLPFIEVPISGTSATLARGEAVGLVAGEPADIALATRWLDALCPQRHLLGAAGNGGRAKLAVNLVLGLHRGALAEGLVFAERLGLAPEPFLAVLKGSAAYSRVMDVKGSMMATRRFEPVMSRVDQSLKDFGLIHALAAAHDQGLPFAAVYTALLQDAVAVGDASRDNGVIIEAVARQRHGNPASHVDPDSPSTFEPKARPS